MSSLKIQKSNSKIEFMNEEDIYNIKIFRRTSENNTHEVIEDNKIKKVTSWRKSKKKYLQSLIFNIFSIGIVHIISLFYPNLYIKLYCNRRKPKECDFFLVEDIYGNLTLCKKIYKKDKSQKNISYSSQNSKEVIISSSLPNYNGKSWQNLTKNLTYSFIYRSITYEYNEQSNEIIPVYMNLLNLTCKDIFHFFGEGLSSEGLIKIFQNRYGKNEYFLNFKLIYLYLLNIELPNIILVIVVGIVELFLNDYISFIAKMIIIVILLGAEFINLKVSIYNSYKSEYTLDGENKKIRAKRSHKFDEKSEIFCEIDNCDLLPGDIIFLKSNDIVPCDCLILEGECMANSNNLLGNLNIFRKVSLENKNVPFSYKINKDNILYHGMKIVKTYSNLNQEYISALCINTGPNSYKANLFSNILYVFERRKEYKDSYKVFNSDRKSFSFIQIGILVISILVGLFYTFLIMDNSSEIFDFKNKETLELFISIIIRVICKTIMPMFYLLKSFILLLGVINLKSENVFTFDKSKLLISSTIDTIFIGKTGTLCADKFEINSYHPVCVSHHNINSLSFRIFKATQNKEINLQLVKYYKNYLNKKNETVSSNFKLDYYKTDPNEKKIMKSCEYSTRFLESLLSCNNLEKYGMEIFGNSIDTEIYKAMKWDIKADINYSNMINSDIDYPYQKYDENDEYEQLNISEKTRNDIFPSNYYKITESTKHENKNEPKNIINNNIMNFSNLVSNINMDDEKSEKRGSIMTNRNNMIETDIFECHINSYKLRIYKRFIKDRALSSSSITYNFITKELRFNTKGIPEDILDKCNPSTIPENFDKIISLYRRKGFIVIICASKRISIDQYSEHDPEEKYMVNLTFYGFITLKNKLKDEVIYALNDLRLFNCNFIINTGDDIYNTLPVGFESTILENKDIYSFDKDDFKNRIIIKKIFNSKNNYDRQEEKEPEQNIENNNTERFSKISKNYKTSTKSPTSRLKPSKLYENSDSNLPPFLKPDKKVDQYLLDGNNKQNQSEATTPKSNNYKKGNNSIISVTSYLSNNDSKNLLIPSNKQIRKNLQRSQKNLNLFDFNNRKNLSKFNQDNNRGFYNDKNEILYYYPEIFEEHKELTEDCIFCVNGRVFEFLFQNKHKRHAKQFLELIHKKCRIFYNMTSISKSKVIDYYREFKNNCICTIGESQSDIDSIISSDIGINLKPPRNYNTILCHFYSPEENLLTIKKIIKAGRAIRENILLMKISCSIYTLMLNSYILCCFIRQMDIIQGQLNFLEIGFLILSITAFRTKADSSECSNSLLQNNKLYVCHYILQIVGLIIIKAVTIYFHAHVYHSNDFIDVKEHDRIYTTFYFLFCVEQLFSTIYVLNTISFYRESWAFNNIFIVFALLIFVYFAIITTLTDSNYNIDIFNFLYFEYVENIVDTYGENNKQKIFLVCILEYAITIAYSRIIFHIFDKLSRISSKKVK